MGRKLHRLSSTLARCVMRRALFEQRNSLIVCDSIVCDVDK